MFFRCSALLPACVPTPERHPLTVDCFLFDSFKYSFFGKRRNSPVLLRVEESPEAAVCIQRYETSPEAIPYKVARRSLCGIALRFPKRERFVESTAAFLMRTAPVGSIESWTVFLL